MIFYHMELFIAIVYGLVQSVTELLPISSSGHLVLLHRFLPFSTIDPLAFDVSLHLASLMAIVIYFWKDWWTLLINKNYDHVFSGRTKTVFMIIISTIPAGVVGVLFDDWIENNVRSSWVVVFTLIFVAVLMILVEKYFYKPNSLKQFNKAGDAFKIGLAQACALIPGVSRSGATITMAMALGYDKVSAAKISFMMATPIIFGAAIFKIKDTDWSLLNTGQWRVLLISWIITFGASLLVFKLLMKYLPKISWRWFAYYRIILAVIVLLLSL